MNLGQLKNQIDNLLRSNPSAVRAKPKIVIVDSDRDFDYCNVVDLPFDVQNLEFVQENKGDFLEIQVKPIVK